MVILFEEIGLPVVDKINNERVFYLELGNNKLSTAMHGFVGHQSGCWIFMSQNGTEKGQLQKYYCGDAYQSIEQLKSSIDKF